MDEEDLTGEQLIEWCRGLPPVGAPVPVRFLRLTGPYNTGERAAFPASVAERLVQRGVVEYA